MLRVTAVLCVLGITVVSPAVAVQTPHLEVLVPEHPVRLGDHLTMRVLARGGTGWSWGDELEIHIADDTTGTSAWAVAETPQAVAGLQPPAWEIHLVPLNTGEQQLPALQTTAQPPGGERRTVVARHPATIRVGSVLPPGAQPEPAPLRGPVGAHGLAWEWLLPCGLLLAPVLALSGLWLRSRRSPGLQSSHIPAPHERLQALVAELRESMDETPAEAVCDRLATGLRRFLEERTGEPALEMTSAELLDTALRDHWPPLTLTHLQLVLGLVDEVRFARRPVSREQLHAAVTATLMIGREIEARWCRLESQRDASEGPP